MTRHRSALAALCIAVIALGVPAVAYALTPVRFVYERDLASLTVRDGAFADFNEDGHDDVVFAIALTGWPWSGLSDTGFRTGLSDGSGGYSFLPEDARFANTGGTIAAADLNGDGHTDVVVGTDVTSVVGVAGRLQVWFNDGHAAWSPGPFLDTSGLVYDVTTADFDGDGATDLAATDSRTLFVWRGDGAGTFTRTQTLAFADEFKALAVGDFDEDGRPDLVTTTLEDGLVLRNLGGCTFGIASSTPIPWWFDVGLPRTASVETGDFDADGNLDFAAPVGQGGLVAYFGDGDCGVMYQADLEMFIPAGDPTDLDVTDLNGDGFDDIMQRCFGNWTHVYLSDGAGGFELFELGLYTPFNEWLEVIHDTPGGPPVLLTGVPFGRWVLAPEDVDPPVPTATFDPVAPPADGWYRAPVRVSLSAGDGTGWGVRALSFALDDEPESAYGYPLDVSSDGLHELTVWALDWADNEGESTFGFGVDTLPPATTAMRRAPEVGRVTWDFVATDAGSGVAGTSYMLDGVPGTGTSVSCSVLGPHKLDYWSFDRIGRVETLKTVTFTVAAIPSEPGYVPVHRFYNFRKGVHFYTASEAERNSVATNLRSTYRYEGVSYFVHTSNPANSTPLWRFYNVRKGVHFYTASESEKNQVLQKLSGVYKLEGVAYSVCTIPVAGATPVHRFYNLKAGVHFYTASEAEKASVEAKLSTTYRYEGVGYYLAP